MDRSEVARALVALALVVLAATDAAFAACPMCKTALLSPEGQRVAKAFDRGILLLLGAPFAAAATIGALMVNASRRSRLPAGARGVVRDGLGDGHTLRGMIDREHVLAILRSCFPSASPSEFAAATNAIMALPDEWEEVTEVSPLAERGREAGQWRIFKRRSEAADPP